MSRISGWFKRPVIEETLVDAEGKIVDAEVNGRRLTYAHERSPEMEVLTAYREGQPDTPWREFYDTHVAPGTRRQRKAGTDWARVLEEVVVYHDDDTEEVFRNPQGVTFEYVDRQGNTFRATAHDPVANAVVAQARERYADLSNFYGQLLKDVQQEARKKVSR